MQTTATPSHRVTAAQDALAAFGLAVIDHRELRRERRTTRAVVRAQRRADRAARLALRGLPVTQPPRA